MDTIDVLYDSRDPEYKDPVGAVTSGTGVTFTLLVAGHLHPTKVGISMLYDRHEAPAYYEMTRGNSAVTKGGTSQGDPSGSLDGGISMIPFSTEITIGDTGLYWYHFVIDTDNGTLLVGKDGHSNRPLISGDPAAWQQTVYDRKYEVPEWICGGAFYHIFVDRFRKGSSAADYRPGQEDREEARKASDREYLPASQEGPEEGPEAAPHQEPEEPLPAKIVRNDWGGTPNWKPVDGKVYNNDFFGGNIRGIIEKLPYIAGLGVTCLYLSPVFEAYSSHKYDTGDYEKVDEMFGTDEELRELCEKAGALGIRVILDGVFAHTGADSKYFNKYGTYDSNGVRHDVPVSSVQGKLTGAWNDPDSPYRSWYMFHEDGTYDSWWDFETLPKLNKLDPGYIEYITGENGIIRKWLKTGASGWRLDVADELPVSFLTKLVQAAKAEKPDSLIVGEVWEDASNKEAYSERKNYFEGDRLDSVMNYPFRQGIIDLVRNGNAGGLAETVEQVMENYPREVVDCLMNLLGTHDSIRIITALAGEDLGKDPSREIQAETRLSREDWDRGVRLLKAASLLQITLPGVPCIYYGDEAGVEGYKDPFNRTCYPWGYENKELQSWYRMLLNYRKGNPVFRHGSYRTIAASDGLYAFYRSTDMNDVGSSEGRRDSNGSSEGNKAAGGRPRDVLVILNMGDTERAIGPCPCDKDPGLKTEDGSDDMKGIKTWSDEMKGRRWRDVITGKAFDLTCTVPSCGMLLLESF